jgi:hypothetical protein
LKKQWKKEEEWTKTESDLAVALDELSDTANREVEKSTKDATFWRYTAWAFTVLGGVLVGDWKTLLAGPDAGGDEQQTGTVDASA